MKKRYQILLLLAVAVFLTACPYKSRVPIGDADEKIDNKLMGKWVNVKNKEDENPEYYEIKKYDKFKYEIDKYSYSTYDSSYNMEKYISHINTLGNNMFMNMQKNGTGDYYLYKIEFDGKSMTLFEITDNIDETFNTSAELKTFVEKNMNLSFFYNKDEAKYFKE